jgi:hypothetical protein
VTEIQILIAVITQGLRQQSNDLGFSHPKTRNKLPLGSVNFVIPVSNNVLPDDEKG